MMTSLQASLVHRPSPQQFSVSPSSPMLLVITFFLLLPGLCFLAPGVDAQAGKLPAKEVAVLQEIAEQLGKRDWDFNLNPCDGNSNWTTPKRDDMPLYNNTVNCNCSYPGGVCHIEMIFLKGQDLPGVLPPSLAKLPYIKNIDFTRNYLNGTIPPEWASTRLETLLVTANRLSGPIPKYLGNISTLRYMSLESNRFHGNVPAELGKLLNLQNLILIDNKLTGAWPTELTNLKNLTELRVSSNNFSGKIPSLQSWKQLQKLEIQASGFEGPIPGSISLLSNLQELRISDLNGGGSVFPNLTNMTSMRKLMLRSCSMSGPIPDSIAHMSQLKILDLSFNNLEGGIPNLDGLGHLEYMYFTSNFLTGRVPDWIMRREIKHQIDLSYNKFLEDSVPTSCRESLNLYRSYVHHGKNGELGRCLSQCSKDHYSVNINCGGENVTIGETTYEADLESAGAAKFVPRQEYWGTSSTGDFWDHNRTLDDYTARNVSVLKMSNSELYTTARLSALSVTYFARCLANGNYSVTLHFAEIVFRDNRSVQSLGRRFFDVYIQGDRVLKDFDIESEAKGVDKPTIHEFKAIVKEKVLEIRFQFAGKGSTAIPARGHYGPLISAISINSDFKPPTPGISKLVIAIAVVASGLTLIIIILCILWLTGQLERKTSIEEELRGLDLRTGLFTYRQIQAATNNFDSSNKLGEGGFGSVYKGTLLNGTSIAVKQLSSKSRQGNCEFVNEIGIISGLQHPNLVRLYGCCVEKNQLLLVYEYMENNSLARALFGLENEQLELDWPTRQRICVGIAQGLVFMHEESTLKVVHRDIKATNVLLDRDLNPKISDFGLAKLFEEENTHISTRVAGTIGYMAPEYALWGHLTFKADVYSFGVLAVEIVSGKNNMNYRPSEDYVCLLDWAIVLQEKGNLEELLDPKLGSNLNKEEAIRMIKVALLCTSSSPALRPTMSAVVSMIKGDTEVPERHKAPSIYDDNFNIQALRKDIRHDHNSSEIEENLEEVFAPLIRKGRQNLSVIEENPEEETASLVRKGRTNSSEIEENPEDEFPSLVRKGGFNSSETEETLEVELAPLVRKGRNTSSEIGENIE